MLKCFHYSDLEWGIKLVPGGSSVIAQFSFTFSAEFHIMTSSLFLLQLISSKAKEEKKNSLNLNRLFFFSLFVLKDSRHDSQTK